MNGVRSSLEVPNGSFFERENYELRNYELWRRLHKSLMIRLVRHVGSEAIAPDGGIQFGDTPVNSLLLSVD